MTEMPGMVERVARAICVSMEEDPDAPDTRYVRGWRLYRSDARAAIAAHEAALRDAGMVIVPREANGEMVSAACRVVYNDDGLAHIAAMYREMVAAAHRCSATNPESTSPVGDAEGGEP